MDKENIPSKMRQRCVKPKSIIPKSLNDVILSKLERMNLSMPTEANYAKTEPIDDDQLGRIDKLDCGRGSHLRTVPESSNKSSEVTKCKSKKKVVKKSDQSETESDSEDTQIIDTELVDSHSGSNSGSHSDVSSMKSDEIESEYDEEVEESESEEEEVEESESEEEDEETISSEELRKRMVGLFRSGIKTHLKTLKITVDQNKFTSYAKDCDTYQIDALYRKMTTIRHISKKFFKTKEEYGLKMLERKSSIVYCRIFIDKTHTFESYIDRMVKAVKAADGRDVAKNVFIRLITILTIGYLQNV